MCELAILKKEETNKGTVSTAAKELYESQRTALGIVAMKWGENYEGEKKFSYETFRSTEPTPEEIGMFVQETWDDTIRYIIHGRLATHGEMDNRGTHPIELDCPECDIDLVLHNGIVGHISGDKRYLESRGHEWTTTVDSELIAHTMGRIPESTEEAREMLDTHSFLQYQPAFILLNEDRMFIYARHNSKYNITEDGQLLCARRNYISQKYTAIERFVYHADASNLQEAEA